MKIHVINPSYTPPPNAIVVNTTSRSTDWSRGLSPFLIGPIELYDGFVSQNVENAWQFSKVYGHLDHINDDNEPTESYFTWAEKGWQSTRAYRYPMGKGVKPMFSYWDGEKLDYIEARKRIYIPLYSKAVKKTLAYNLLLVAKTKIDKDNKDLYLQDFDAHNLTPGTFDYWDLWNNPHIKVGHAYVLAMMLEGII